MMNTYFNIGFGRTNITPKEPVPLGGYGNTSFRFFKAIRDDLYATCIALSDSTGGTVILLETDGLVMDEPVLGMIQSSIEEQLGISRDRVMVSVSHSHSTPDIWNVNEPSIQRYHKLLAEQLTEAARQAVSDLSEAKLYYSSIELENMNFVRHYYNVDENGEKHFFGDNFGKPVYDSTTGHATEADPTMHVLRIVREGKKEIVLINWRCHPHFTGGSKRYELSAYYVGAYRKALQAMRDCWAVFFQGCGGNLNEKTRLAEERRYTTCESYGMNLAAKAIECLETNMTEAAAGPVIMKKVWLDGKLDHRTDHLVEQAKKVREIWATTNDMAKTMEIARPFGIRSPYHANAIISKAARPETREMELNAIALGPDIAIVTGSEMFDTVSMATEEASVFRATITMGYCNAYRGYIPSKYGFEYTCYESDVAMYAPGIAEQISDTYIQMLQELKNRL